MPLQVHGLDPVGQCILIKVSREHVGQPVRSMVRDGRYAPATAHVYVSATQGPAARAKGEQPPELMQKILECALVSVQRAG